MVSLRRSRSHPLARFAACVLVPALVLAALPTVAEPCLLGQNPSYPIQDELYRLTSDTVTIGALNQYSKGFTYDDVGNRQTQTTSIGPAGSVIPGVLVNGTQAYTYDERDRLLTETLDANPATTYGWDVDGNLVSKSAEATYEWDREMRMVRVTKTDGTIVEHVYDFDGVRVQTRTTPAGGSTTTTNFLVDTSGSLSHVVAETDATGALVVHYVRGDDLLAVMRPNGSGGWASRFYHADHIGSVRRLTNEAGTVTDGYTYDAFGTLLAHTGTDPQPYAFTGEPYDPNVGFQYHRARWMDPRVGRFLATDPRRGNVEDPTSLHRYLYADVDPANRLDPTGEFTVAEGLSVVAILAVGQARHPARPEVLDAGRIPSELQLPGTGVGPVTLRYFTTGVMPNSKSATDVIGAMRRDINRFSTVPGTFGAASPGDIRFKCVAGSDCSEIVEGNIYSIDGPMLFNPYVKATTATSQAFEFTTMKGHPEAAQVKFLAGDLAGGTLFTIRIAGHPATNVNYSLYWFAGHFMQTQIWDNYIENVREFATSR